MVTFIQSIRLLSSAIHKGIVQLTHITTNRIDDANSDMAKKIDFIERKPDETSNKPIGHKVHTLFDKKKKKSISTTATAVSSKMAKTIPTTTMLNEKVRFRKYVPSILFKFRSERFRI